MRGNRLFSIIVTMAVLFMAAGCNGGKSSGSSASGRLTSATIKIGFNTNSTNALHKTAGAPLAAVGTAEEVSSVTVDVYNGSNSIVTGVPLTNNNGTWSVTLQDLPEGVALTMTAHAYNASSQEIFTGTTQLTIGGPNEQVTIAMNPVTAGTQFLRITHISRPGEVLTESVNPVSFSVSGNAGETLSYEVIADANGGGSFSNSSGSISLVGTTATVVLMYTAPPSTGSFNHVIRITDSHNTSVETSFDTNVTSVLTSAAVNVLQFNPVVTALTAARNDTDITFGATVSDAGPQEELTYQWSFVTDQGYLMTMSNDDGNPSNLRHYDDTVSGTLTLTVANAANGSTTITYRVNAGQFPVSIVSSVMHLPQTGIRIADACAVAAVSGDIIAVSLDTNLGNTLGYYRISTGVLVRTNIAIALPRVSVEGDIISFVYRESNHLGYYSISTDTATDTQFTADITEGQLELPTRQLSNGRIAYVSGGNLAIYDIAQEQNTDTGVAASLPSFSQDLVAFVGADGKIKYYDVATGLTSDTGVTGNFPDIENGIIVFDTGDYISYYDIANAKLVQTPLRNANNKHGSISGGIIAGTLPEGGAYGDLNANGVIDNNPIIVLYDIATGRMINTGLVACCGPALNGLVLTWDDDDGCYTWYAVINDVARMYFGR